ncbi:hypothetical protein [Virgibacillus halophilus]|uniref:hypothetical protein n=1 Tax=Tigheibacillus halophilus TaxID=361280 RepID=UPI0036F2ED2B
MKKIVFDLKFLTGIIFCYLGLVLFVYGLFTDKKADFPFPINVNLWWGIVTFLFGLAFFIVAFVTHKKADTAEEIKNEKKIKAN